MGKLFATKFTSNVKCGSCGNALPKVPIQRSHVALKNTKNTTTVVELMDLMLVTDLHVGIASEVDKMFVKVSRWKVSGTNKFMTT